MKMILTAAALVAGSIAGNVWADEAPPSAKQIVVNTTILSVNQTNAESVTTPADLPDQRAAGNSYTAACTWLVDVAVPSGLNKPNTVGVALPTTRTISVHASTQAKADEELKSALKIEAGTANCADLPHLADAGKN